MRQRYSTHWVISRNMKAIEMFDSQREARDWMSDRGYQDDGPNMPRYVRVQLTFGPTFGT